MVELDDEMPRVPNSGDNGWRDSSPGDLLSFLRKTCPIVRGKVLGYAVWRARGVGFTINAARESDLDEETVTREEVIGLVTGNDNEKAIVDIFQKCAELSWYKCAACGTRM